MRWSLACAGGGIEFCVWGTGQSAFSSELIHTSTHLRIIDVGVWTKGCRRSTHAGTGRLYHLIRRTTFSAYSYNRLAFAAAWAKTLTGWAEFRISTHAGTGRLYHFVRRTPNSAYYYNRLAFAATSVITLASWAFTILRATADAVTFRIKFPP